MFFSQQYGIMSGRRRARRECSVQQEELMAAALRSEGLPGKRRKNYCRENVNNVGGSRFNEMKGGGVGCRSSPPNHHIILLCPTLSTFPLVYR